jgi:serine/threonine protein phosphatase PrpC
MSIKTVSYATSNIGRVRSSNQDSGYSGYQTFFVADGMGGHAGGDIASAMVAQRVAQIDGVFPNAESAKAALVKTVLEANKALSQTVKEHSELSGMGTTFSGLIISGDDITIAHIGDSRIYLSREGEFSQLTSDHTFVQRLVDLGRITPQEALTHPRRSVLMRVLGDVEENPEIDTLSMKAQIGDRWMLCSDGLCGVVPETIIDEILRSPISAKEAGELLVGEALEYGGPDNITVVVLDVLPANAPTDFVPTASYVGSAANEIIIDDRRGSRLLRIFNPRLLTELLGQSEETAEFAKETDEYLDYIMSQTRTKIRNHQLRQIATVFGLVILVIGLLGLGLNYTQTRFYVGQYQGNIAIFQGIKESLGPLKFSHVYKQTNVPVSSLAPYQRSLVWQTVVAESYPDALREIKILMEQGK